MSFQFIEAVDWRQFKVPRSDTMTHEVILMSGLAEKTCVPCRGGVPPLTADQIRPLLAQLSGWAVVNSHHIEKQYEFPDFKTALDFVNRVGAIAEDQGHHPDIALAWGRVGVRIWTHKIDGLTESDFILAAKIDRA
jgi:4a-hydroxytetrahydrobiopterin dehydratase